MMEFKCFGMPRHDGVISRKCASEAARAMVKEEIEKGKGPTEAFEDVALKIGSAVPSLGSIRKAKNPGSRSVSTQVQLLCLLQRTYKATVNPDSPVPGYLQVSVFLK